MILLEAASTATTWPDVALTAVCMAGAALIMRVIFR